MIADSLERPKKNGIYIVSTEQKIKGVTSLLQTQGARWGVANS